MQARLAFWVTMALIGALALLFADVLVSQIAGGVLAAGATVILYVHARREIPNRDR